MTLHWPIQPSACAYSTLGPASHRRRPVRPRLRSGGFQDYFQPEGSGDPALFKLPGQGAAVHAQTAGCLGNVELGLDEGLVEVSVDGRLRLTRNGMLVANEIMVVFIGDAVQ